MKVPVLVDFGDFCYDVTEIRGYGKGGEGYTWIQCGDMRQAVKLPVDDVAARIETARSQARQQDDE